MEAMSRFLLVCLGGALGTGARYLVSGWTARWLGAGFPYGTLAVNVVGSFVLAVLMVLGTETSAMPATTRVVLTTGVMGGFTTYSSFSYETMKLLQESAWQLAALNVAASVLGCLGACMLGWAGAKWMLGT
jgi:CrcB protein